MAKSKNLNFNNFGLKKEIIESLKINDIETPTEVQKLSIQKILHRENLVIQSQTGSGKTLAYLLPRIQETNIKLNIQTLIIVPTKELAMQIKSEINKFGNHLNVKGVAFYGGKETKSDTNILQRKNHIVVGTPGRIIDYVNSKAIKLGEVKTFILDEADKLLEMGFIKDIQYLFSRIPLDSQIILLSATQNDELLDLIEHYLYDAERIIIDEDMIPEQLKQFYTLVENKDKKNKLIKILKENSDKKIIVFANKIIIVENLLKVLRKEKLPVKIMHGKLTSKERQQIFNEFKSNKFNILVATDIASRGLDNQKIDLIINHDLPTVIYDYVHRVGRTARIGKAGKAISFVCSEDEKRREWIEALTKSHMNKLDD